VTFAIFVPLNFILTPLFDVPGTSLLTRGPALATSIAATANTLLLLFFAAKRFGGINARRMVISLAKVLLACVPMAAVAHLLYRAIAGAGGHGHLVAFGQLLLAGGLGLAVYGAFAVLLKCEELTGLKSLIRRRRRTG
jgi:peptidoglycan biosynthesis protein MviN/MurJ (putative lipid II flippase)